MLTRNAGTLRAVWYRHWLEHAGAALVALGVAAPLCVAYGVAVYRGRDPLVAHVVSATAAAWFLPLFLHGTGIRTNDLQPGHRSLYYTLTLPVPRSVLVWTRFAVACASATVLQALMLGINAATLTLVGSLVPFGAMAAASTVATLLMLTVVAAIGLMNLWDDRIGLLGFPVAFIVVMLVGWRGAVGLIASVPVPWSSVATMGVAIGTMLALTMLLARTRDF